MGNSFIFDDEPPEQPEPMEAEPGTGGEAPPPEEGNNRTFLLAIGALGAIVLLALLCLAAYAGFILPRQRAQQAAQNAAQLAQNTAIAAAATGTAGAQVSGPSYTIQPGDTLAALALRFGIALDALRNANPGVSDTPNVGVVIVIPQSSQGSNYTVQPGDTLLDIANRFGLSLDALKNSNPGVGDTLSPGQVLRIPLLVGLLPSPAPQVTITSTPVVVFATSTPIVVPTVNPITATVAAAYTQAALAQLTVIPTSTALGAVPSTGFADQVGLPLLLLLGALFIVIIFLVRRVRTAR
jgi:LysM repeat protein